MKKRQTFRIPHMGSGHMKLLQQQKNMTELKRTEFIWCKGAESSIEFGVD